MTNIPVETQIGIERFLAHEAHLLENHRFDDWLELMADDVHYVMPVRESVERVAGVAAQPDTGFALYDDDKNSLALRAGRIDTGVAHAEVPSSVTQRLITNIYVRRTEVEDEYDVRSNFMVYQERRGRHGRTFIGSRTDRLRRANGEWKIARREIRLAQAILPAAISIFF